MIGEIAECKKKEDEEKHTVQAIHNITFTNSREFI